MNNLFSSRSSKKNLFTKAFVTASSKDLIDNTIANLYPELAKLNTENSYNVFINSKPDMFEVSLYSQNTHILTLFKINMIELQKEIADVLIDKKLLLSYDLLKLKVYFK